MNTYVNANFQSLFNDICHMQNAYKVIPNFKMHMHYCFLVTYIGFCFQFHLLGRNIQLLSVFSSDRCSWH